MRPPWEMLDPGVVYPSDDWNPFAEIPAPQGYEPRPQTPAERDLLPYQPGPGIPPFVPSGEPMAGVSNPDILPPPDSGQAPSLYQADEPQPPGFLGAMRSRFNAVVGGGPTRPALPPEKPQVDAVSGADAVRPRGLANAQPENPYPPERPKSLFQREMEAQDAIGGIERKKAESQYEMAQKRSQDIADYDQMQVVAEHARQKRVAGYIEEIGKLQVDPDRWMNETGVGGKIALGVSAFISGFLNPGKPNATLQWINEQIERDIVAQRENLMSRGSMLKEMIGMTGDERVAAEATRAKMLAKAARDVDLAGMKFSGQEAEANRQALKLGLEREYAMAIGKAAMEADKLALEGAKDAAMAEDRQNQRKIDMYNAQTGRYRAGEDARRNRAQEDIDRMKAGREITAEERGRTIYSPTGEVLGQARDEHAARAVSEYVVNAVPQVRKARRLKYLMEKYGKTSFLSEDERQEMISLRGQLTVKWAKGNQMGALDKGLQQMSETVIPAPGSVTNPKDYFRDNVKTLDQFIMLGEQDIRDFTGPYGFKGDYVGSFTPKGEKPGDTSGITVPEGDLHPIFPDEATKTLIESNEFKSLPPEEQKRWLEAIREKQDEARRERRERSTGPDWSRGRDQ